MIIPDDIKAHPYEKQGEKSYWYMRKNLSLSKGSYLVIIAILLGLILPTIKPDYLSYGIAIMAIDCDTHHICDAPAIK